MGSSAKARPKWVLVPVVAGVLGLAAVGFLLKRSSIGPPDPVPNAASPSSRVASPQPSASAPSVALRPPSLDSLTKDARAAVLAAPVAPPPGGPREVEDGWIRRMPKRGGPAETVVTHVFDGHSLALDATHVYWQETPRHSLERLKRAPKTGGAPQKLFEHCAPRGFAVGPSALYVATVGCELLRRDGIFPDCGPGKILALSKDGAGAQKELASIEYPFQLRAVDETLYFKAGCGMSKLHLMDVAGGSAPTWRVEVQAFDWVIDAGRVYHGSHGKLLVHELSSSKKLHEINLDARPLSVKLAVDETAVYLVNEDKGTIESWPKRGDEAKLLVTLGGSPGPLVAARQDLFVADRMANVVWRIPKRGGQPSVAAREVGSPEALAQDDDYVYWIVRPRTD